MRSVSPVRKISQSLSRWPLALLAVLVLAAVVLLPMLGRPGLWEPGERTLADRVAPPDSVQAQLDEQKRKLAAAQAQQPQQPKPPAPVCRKAPPDDAIARSLSHRAMTFGRDRIADSDGGRKLPFALLGLLTVLATAGIAMRASPGSAGARSDANASRSSIGRPRAGLVTAIVLLSMPLLVLQSRMLTSDIGTACGAALVIYGLVTLHRRRGVHLGLQLGESLVGALALAAGIVIGFVAGGALLGLLVPIGAVAAAGKLGIPFVANVGKAVYNGALRVARRTHPRWAATRTPLAYDSAGHGPAFLATLVAIALIGLLAYQLYDLRPPHPGIVPPARRVGDVAIVPEGCWSWLLGGVWRAEDDLRYTFDSAFEDIAYGTYPWGILGPIAMLLLLRDPDPKRRFVGALTLAWAGGAWIATEAFHRKVGITIWAGFPALAIAIGVWLDAALDRRARTRGDAGDLVPAGAVLLALFVALAVLDFGKDLVAFPERLTSLLAGNETVQYPANARLLFVKVKHWVLVLGMLTMLGVVGMLALWRTGESRAAGALRKAALLCAAGGLGATIVLAAFWAFAWHPRMAEHLSSKAMFETYRSLREPGDQLVIMGDLGHAPLAYADAPRDPKAPGDQGWEKAVSRDHVVNALARPNRVFAIVPQTELCHLHRELGDRPYYVIDDRNLRNLLFSNKLDGATDKNPLRDMIVHQPPSKIAHRPKGPVVWGNSIELLGWDIPKVVRRGQPFEVTVYYKIRSRVDGNWTAIMHFDGAIRFSGDHKPIKDRCPTSTWQAGDYIIDRHTVVAGSPGHPLGKYDLWIGFFTGTAPNFKNMEISQAPSDIKDATHRVKITSVFLD